MTSKFSFLSDISVIIDSLHKTPKYSDTGRPMVRATDVKYGPLDLKSTYKVDDSVFSEFSRRYQPSKGDVIITRVGSYGNTAYVNDTNFCLGQNTAAIIPKINPLYLFLALNSPHVRHQIESSVVGSTQKTLSLKAISKLEIPRLSPEVENHIAEVGGKLDNKIQLNQQINQTLEQMAQAIFKSWFVDFEPVKTKIAARERWHAQQPGNESASPTCYAGELASQPININLDTYMNHAAMQAISGKDAEQLALMQAEQPEEYAELYATAELFPSAMQDSELGEIPEGWDVCPVQSRYQITIGKTPPRKEPKWFSTCPQNIKWLSIKKMGDGYVFVTDTDEYLTPEAINQHNIKLCPVGTVLLSFKLTLGRVGIANAEMATNEAIAHFRISSKSPGTCWTYLYLSLFDYNSLGSTSSIATAVNSKTIKEMLLVLPDVTMLQCFESKVEPLFECIRNSQLNSESLVATRDTLLPKLLSGELSVADIESEAEA